MAYNPQTYGADGSNTLFPVTFPYINQADVTLTINGLVAPVVFANAQSVSIVPPPARGALVFLGRSSIRLGADVIFKEGSLSPKDLNKAVLQLTYAVEEVLFEKQGSSLDNTELVNAAIQKIQDQISEALLEALSAAQDASTYILGAQQARDMAAAYASQLAASLATASNQAVQAATSARNAAAAVQSSQAGAQAAALSASTARLWSLSTTLVNDGQNPAGYSAYYWAQQAKTLAQGGSQNGGTPANGSVGQTQLSPHIDVGYFDYKGGAITRSASSKLSDITSMADFADTAGLASVRRMWVPPGVYHIGSSITVTADLVFDQGAVLDIAAGATVTFAGHLDAPKRQIFSGAGTVAFTGTAHGDVYPEWWGARCDDSDCTGAVQACLQSATRGNKKVVLSGLYTLRSGAAHVAGPGSLEIAGGGMETTGFLLRNTEGGIFFSGTMSNLDWDLFHIHDFQVTAMDSQRNCGDGIRATWPAAGGNILPTLLARNLLFQSETYGSDEPNHGYFTNMLLVSQANVCRIENFNGIHIGNKTAAHIRIQNSSAPGIAVYECHIHRPNMQGGKYGIVTSGEIEELLIEPLGIDSPEFCIWSDGTNGGGSGNANNGVITVRGGDLNGHKSCIQIFNWTAVQICDVNMGIFTLFDNVTSEYDCMQIYGSWAYSSQVQVTGCQFGAGNQVQTAALCRIFHMFRAVFCDNRLDGGGNGLIHQGVDNDGNQSILVANNQLSGVVSPDGEVGIFIASGDRALVIGNQVAGYGTGIALFGTNARARGNQVLNCASPYNVNRAKGNIQEVPVTQGLGPGQTMDTTVSIGNTAGGASPRISLDGTDYGVLWSDHDAPSQLSRPGYQKLPSGLIMQWGYVAGGGDQQVNFPLRFPTELLNLQIQMHGNASQQVVIACGYRDESPSGFFAQPRASYMSGNNGQGDVTNMATVPFYWTALGH